MSRQVSEIVVACDMCSEGVSILIVIADIPEPLVNVLTALLAEAVEDGSMADQLDQLHELEFYYKARHCSSYSLLSPYL